MRALVLRHQYIVGPLMIRELVDFTLLCHDDFRAGLPLLLVHRALLVRGAGGNAELRQSCFVLHHHLDVGLLGARRVRDVLVWMLLAVVPRDVASCSTAIQSSSHALEVPCLS